MHVSAFRKKGLDGGVFRDRPAHLPHRVVYHVGKNQALVRSGEPNDGPVSFLFLNDASRTKAVSQSVEPK